MRDAGDHEEAGRLEQSGRKCPVPATPLAAAC